MAGTCQSCQRASAGATPTACKVYSKTHTASSLASKHTTNGPTRKFHSETWTLTTDIKLDRCPNPGAATGFYLRRAGGTKPLSVPPTPPRLPLTPCLCLPCQHRGRGVRGWGARRMSRRSEENKIKPNISFAFRCWSVGWDCRSTGWGKKIHVKASQSKHQPHRRKWTAKQLPG